MAMIHLLGSLGHDPSARNLGICVTEAPACAGAVCTTAIRPPAIMATTNANKIAIVRNCFFMAVILILTCSARIGISIFQFDRFSVRCMPVCFSPCFFAVGKRNSSHQFLARDQAFKRCQPVMVVL